MKHIKTLFNCIILSFLLFAVQSCNDDDDNNPDPNVPAGQAMNDFFANNKLDVIVKTANLTPGRIDTIDLGKGYKLIVLPGSMMISGNPVTGDVTVTARLIDNKSDMVRGNISCIGDSGKCIVSSGMMKLDITQNGTRPTFNSNNPYKIQVPMKGPAQSNFYGFRGGGTNNTDSSVWVRDMKSVAQQYQSSYLFAASSLNFLNCDQFYSSNNVKYDVKLPAGYTNSNATAYAVLKNQNSVIRMFGNSSTQSFDFGVYNGLPAGTPVTIVVIASQGNQLQYAGQDYNSATGTVTFNSLTNTTDAALRAYLDAL